MMKSKRPHGFSLIELLVVIVVIGILAAVAMQSMTASVEDTRRITTEREMDMLAKAIVGDPGQTQNHQRSDFGYVGDIGAFPPYLQALYENPGGYATWKGPYFPVSLTQDSTGFKTDEWGFAYSYSGGLTITSTGSGSSITRRIADASSDYLLNRVSGMILDAAHWPPGPVSADSINIVITYPDGSGSTAAKVYHPDSTGRFTLDSIPAGIHPIIAVYQPEADTVNRYLTVLPRHQSPVSYRFAAAYFGPVGGTYVLRPDGPGALTSLTNSGCTENYLCVNEAVSDEDATTVIRASGSLATDVYTMDDPPDTSWTIQSVTVFCRARRTRSQGSVQPTIYVAGGQANGPEQDLTDSYAVYQYTWATDPVSGAAWTWTDVINLQAGVRLRGQNATFPAYCTQVWAEVTYER